LNYQIELLDHALTKNTIVSLGTGAGKTFVAVLLIKEYSHRLLNNNEKAVFLVNTGSSTLVPANTFFGMIPF
jgi:endoribonuclease Dicer